MSRAFESADRFVADASIGGPPREPLKNATAVAIDVSAERDRAGGAATPDKSAASGSLVPSQEAAYPARDAGDPIARQPECHV